jgi:hypothetical protein
MNTVQYLYILVLMILNTAILVLRFCSILDTLGRSWRAEIWHEYALLVATSNYILRFEFFEIRLRVLLKSYEIFLKKCQKNLVRLG